MATILAHNTVKQGMAQRFEEIATELYVQTHRVEPNARRYSKRFMAQVADWWIARRG